MELLNCPFCNGPGEIQKIWFGASWRYYVVCKHCLVAPQGYDPGSPWGDHQPYWKTEEEAARLWNCRDITDHLAALEAAVKDEKEQRHLLWELVDKGKNEIAALTAQVDLMLDEFVRISTCPGVTDEIKGLCIRGQQGIEQTVPVIVQRDKALKENEKLTAENKRLKEALEKIAQFNSYHQEWPEDIYVNAPPEEVAQEALHREEVKDEQSD